MSMYNKLIIAASILTVVIIICLGIFDVEPPKVSYEGMAATAISEYKIDINTAEKNELVRCEGLGEKTAEAIIEYRNKNGKFNSVDDLLNVKGVGEKKLNAWRDFLCVK